MSDTKCECGHEMAWHLMTGVCDYYKDGQGCDTLCRAWSPPAPAEPVIEVAPGEPTCEYCGPVCYRGARHNARVEDGARYTDDPAVPAQEAPPAQKYCDCPRNMPYYDWSHNVDCELYMPLKDDLAEPQAGAQELFPGANDMRAPTGMENLRDAPPIVYEGNMAFAQFVGVIEEAEQAGAQVPSQDDQAIYNNLVALKAWLRRYQQQDFITAINHVEIERAGLYQAVKYCETRLNSIKSYATEAAKTPITREDMHDPLKAQTFWDEAKGFERLVLSEIGGGK